MSLSPVHTSYMTKLPTKNKVLKSPTKLMANSALNGSWIPANKNKKTNKIKGVIDFFQENSSSSNLNTIIGKVEKRQHLMASLYEALESVKLDSIANQLEPGTISPDGTLVLQVKHSTTAAKLQQRLPSILRYLRESKWDIIAIRVKVLPISSKSTPANKSVLTSSKIMSEVGKQSWGNLEKNLPPDSSLLEVVQKLISKINK
jgi:hypothetical protein